MLNLGTPRSASGRRAPARPCKLRDERGGVRCGEAIEKEMRDDQIVAGAGKRVRQLGVSLMEANSLWRGQSARARSASILALKSTRPISASGFLQSSKKKSRKKKTKKTGTPSPSPRIRIRRASLLAEACEPAALQCAAERRRIQEAIEVPIRVGVHAAPFI